MNTQKPILPPLKALPAFIEVANQKSFSKAADKLYVTHSAISQQIRLLEDFLKVTLFDRNQGKPVELTPAGKRYFEIIAPSLNQIESITKELLGLSDNNIITVNVITTLTLRWLIPRLPVFQTKHPHIDLRISSLGRNVDFLSDNIDVDIRYGKKPDDPNLHVTQLLSDSLVLIGNTHIKHKGVTLTSLLKKHKAIYVDSPLRQDDWSLWCKKTECAEPNKKNRIYFSSSSQAIQAVISGIGIMVTHKPFIMDELNSSQFCLLSMIERKLKACYYLVYPKHAHKKPSIETVCRWLMSETRYE